jgi:hypothetical protein
MHVQRTRVGQIKPGIWRRAFGSVWSRAALAGLGSSLAAAMALTLPLASQAAGSGPQGRASSGCERGAQMFAADAYTPALRTFDDAIEDSGNAPDFCAEELVTNDSGTITFGIHVHNRSGFVAGDMYSVFLDTDLNSATGGGEVGAEYEITFSGPRALLKQWNGTVFDETTASSVPMFGVPDYGPVLFLERSRIGAPAGFNFVLVSANGLASDRAPDAGSWSYTLRPFALKVKSLSVGAARAGRTLTARAVVLRSDFDQPVDEGKIGCAARVSGIALAGKGRFANDRVVCTWRVPKRSRGKRLSGTLSVALQGARAQRSFAVRVR